MPIDWYFRAASHYLRQYHRTDNPYTAFVYAIWEAYSEKDEMFQWGHPAADVVTYRDGKIVPHTKLLHTWKV